jgi:outer membrane protein assembly factor BamB
MSRIFIALVLSLTSTAANAQWQQWGRDPQHTGASPVAAQAPVTIFADYLYDPFVADEQFAGGGDLLAHFQVPIVDGDDVFMEVKSGAYSLQTWSTQIWNIADLRWVNGKLTQQWITASDWNPPDSEAGAGPNFEPVFHALLVNGSIYMPAAGGTILQLDRTTGAVIRRINPFSSINTTIRVAGPLTSDANGNIYYDAMQQNSFRPWTSDVIDSWLIKVTPSGTTSRVSYRDITPGAPRATDSCLAVFTSSAPWPPSTNAVPGTVTCGSQRPGLNVAPAVAADGTIYTASRAHFNSRYSFLVAVNPDLTPKWMTSMRDRFNDGCNVLIPPNGTSGGCRNGARTGVDPTDNTPGAGRVNDDSTSSPVVAPDGSVYYGAFTSYNYSQGHLMHFSAAGSYLGAYRFGWDITPAIWSHGGSYSVIMKENHYASVGSYCDDPGVCPPGRTAADPEQYFITRLSPSLDVEWQFKATNTKSCERLSNGSIDCFSDHPNGFEWCVNAPAVDSNGVTYVNSEDGFVYAIDATGHQIGSLFLQLAIGAAYTPLSIDSRGRIYTQNAGHMFVVGAVIPVHRRAARH